MLLGVPVAHHLVTHGVVHVLAPRACPKIPSELSITWKIHLDSGGHLCLQFELNACLRKFRFVMCERLSNFSSAQRLIFLYDKLCSRIFHLHCFSLDQWLPLIFGILFYFSYFKLDHELLAFMDQTISFAHRTPPWPMSLQTVRPNDGGTGAWTGES